jgi:hypothetical protein
MKVSQEIINEVAGALELAAAKIRVAVQASTPKPG